jgi:hypothetical protein
MKQFGYNAYVYGYETHCIDILNKQNIYAKMIPFEAITGMGVGSIKECGRGN